MTRYSYDLHMHSCLSPCADDDMTPANIAGMAALNGLQIAALTDHNSCGNCTSFFEACRPHGIIPVPGMELTTAEEIHMVCLFPELENALAFDAEVAKHRTPVKNRVDIYGRQLYMDAEDTELGEEEQLLILATDIDLDDAYRLVRSFGGAAYPAHIDRDANGIIAILGCVPETPDFSFVEYRDAANREAYTERYGLSGKGSVCSSDAHNLWSINEAVNFMELDDEPYSSSRVRHELIRTLCGGEI